MIKFVYEPQVSSTIDEEIVAGSLQRKQVTRRSLRKLLKKFKTDTRKVIVHFTDDKTWKKIRDAQQKAAEKARKDAQNAAKKLLARKKTATRAETTTKPPFLEPPAQKFVPKLEIMSTRKPFVPPKIIGGRPVSLSKTAEVPWQAGIRRINGSVTVHHCGGTIIGRQWILSAAHCFYLSEDPGSYTIRVGDIDNTLADRSEMEYSIEKIITHPSFAYNDLGGFDYDIAMVKLLPKNGSYLTFNDNVRSVYLPTSTTTIYPLTGCKISGWGRTTQDVLDKGTNHLQVADVQVPDTAGQAQCKAEYNNKLTDRMLCAGYLNGTGIDSCTGDSGGPLVCSIKNYDVVVGVTSWGTRKCAVKGYPGIYANVKYFLSWIYSTARSSK